MDLHDVQEYFLQNRSIVKLEQLLVLHEDGFIA
jgi:hypothetical protein